MHRSHIKTCFTAATFALFTCGASALSAQAQLSGTPEELRQFLFPRPDTVNITGEGELTAYKDIANVSLLVTTEERSLNAAMESNEVLRTELISTFLAAGIAEEDINNSKFSSSPQYGIFGRNPSSYEVSARLEVTVNNESHLQLLASSADENNEVEFERIEFEHSEEDSFETQVRELAMQDVMDQREYYESSLGLQLRPTNFYYGGIRQLARSMPQTLMRAEAASGAMDLSASSSAPTQQAAVAPSFDEVEYQTSLTVVFEIVDNN